jgi:hypothetical protein
MRHENTKWSCIFFDWEFLASKSGDNFHKKTAAISFVE